MARTASVPFVVRRSDDELRGASYTSTVETVQGLLVIDGDHSGPGGLPLDHPGELVVGIRIRDRGAAREFASELDLALAEQALRRADGADAALGEGDGPRGSLGPGYPPAPDR